MNELPYVDIIIPVSNGACFIDDCVDSLNKQTYHNYKAYFVVDSESTDNTLEKIEKISEELSWVNIITRDEKTTVSEARNIGIKKTQNELIWFLDVDDYVYPTFLEEMVHLIIDNDAEMVFCNFYQERKRIIPSVSEKKYQVNIYDDYSAIGSFDKLPMYPWAHIQRRELFKNGLIFYNDVPSSEDFDQLIRELSLAKRVCYYNKPLYVYYKRKNSLTMINRQKDALAIEQIARAALPFVKDNNPSNYDKFELLLLNRLMRQMAFVKYREYRKIYKITIAHEIIDRLTRKNREVFVFSKSKLLYYTILFPFTHWLWDNEYGLWDKCKE